MKENIQVFCTRYSVGYHDFYLSVNDKEYFLFRQKFSPSVRQYFAKGVRLDEAMDCSRGQRNPNLLRTMNKVPVSIRYIEKEYDLLILNQTRKAKANEHPEKYTARSRRGKAKLHRTNVEMIEVAS